MINKRVKSLTLENFRGFKGEHKLDLDADLILLSGKNGVGKSSIIYAVDRLLNGYSKDGILTKISNIIHINAKSGKILLEYDDGKTEQCYFNGKENNFINSKDDKYSFLYEISSVFYQEYLENIGIDNIVKIMGGDWLSIRFTTHLNKLSNDFLPTMRQEYFPSVINIEERRKKFSYKWKELIDALKQHREYQDIKQNFFFDNKGTPKYFESQFVNFAKYIIEKYDIKIEDRITPNNEFMNILKYLKKIIKQTNEMEEKKFYFRKVDDFQELLKYSNFFITNTDIDVNNLKPDELHLLSKEKIIELKQKLSEFKRKKDNLEKEIELLTKSLDIWEISGKSIFEEVLDNLITYNRQFLEIKEKNLYYPTEVVLWFGKFQDSIEKIYDIFLQWKENISGIKERYERKIWQIENLIKMLNEELKFNNQLKSYPDMLNKIKQKFKQKGAFTLKELFNEISPDEVDLKPVQTICNEIIELLNDQIEMELKYKEEIKAFANKKSNLDKKKKIIEYIEHIIKKEKSKNGILNSFIQEIPEPYLNNLTHTLNSLLRFFHFPHEFLDLRIKNTGTKAKPIYSIVTSAGKELKFSALSTGQKSQVAIGWVIGLNYLLRERIFHNVIMFDDITTSLDLSQLIPASILFRKMAYSNENNKQVIISSHHEDLTNRFVDFLMPPPAKTLKVIYFEEWSLEAGPKYTEYLVKGKDVKEKNVESFFPYKLNELKSYLGG